MAKFIKRNPSNNRLEEELTVQTSAGAGKVANLDGTGKFDVTLLPTGVGPESETAIATENLSAGHFVNIYDNAGTKSVRRADGSTSGRPVNGFVLSAFSSSALATIYTDGANTQLSGLTAGVDYFLSDTVPGGVTSTPVSGAGKISQRVGKASTTTSIVYEYDNPLTLAS